MAKNFRDITVEKKKRGQCLGVRFEAENGSRVFGHVVQFPDTINSRLKFGSYSKHGTLCRFVVRRYTIQIAGQATSEKCNGARAC